MLSPDRKLVFVPHTGSESIFLFRWDSEAGNLLPNEQAKVTTKPGTGPRHLVFSTKHPLAYVGNEQGGSITAYRIADDGTLSARDTISSLPADFRGQNATAEIRILPDGSSISPTEDTTASHASRSTLKPAR
jgi:6-phosphogluconolactonase